MQKLTSLLCALLIVLSASAVPQFGGKRQSEVLKQMDKTQLVQFLRHKKAQSASHFIRPTATKTAQPARLQAKFADEAPDTVLIASCNGTFYPEDGAIWYGLYTEDWSKTFYFSILVEEGKRDVELGRTYTLADMEEGEEGSSPNHWEDDEWNEHPYTAATFIKTRGAGYDIHVLATVTDTDGHSFVLKFDEKPVSISSDTIDIAFTDNIPNLEYISDGTWMLRAGGEQFGYSVQLSYYSNNQTSCAGTFKGEDIDPSSSAIAEFIKGESEDSDVNFYILKDGDFTVLDTDTAFLVKGNVLGVLDSIGKVFRLDLIVRKPKAEKQVTITANNLSIDDYWYEYTNDVKFLASDDVNEVELVLYPDGLAEEMAGTYTIGLGGTRATVRTVDPMDDVESNAFSGSLELKYDKGSILITGSILCLDNTEYTLDLSYIKPVKTREQELKFDSLDLAVFSDNSWQVLGYNADYSAYISLAGIPADFGETSGTYTEKELVADYSYVVTDITAQSYKRFNVMEANITVDYWEADSVATITGTLLCIDAEDATDVPQFTITIKAYIPNPYVYDEAKAEFNYQFPTFVLDTDYAESGELYVDAMANGYMLGLKFNVAEGTTTLAAGTYEINDSMAEGTILASPGMAPNGQLRYSYAAIVDENLRQIKNAWFLVGGKATVTESGVIELKAVNSKGKAVNVRLGEYPEGVENVQGDKVQITKVLRDGQLVILKNGIEYNAQGAVVK